MHFFPDVSTIPSTIKVSDKMYFKTSFVDCGYVYPVNFPWPEEEDGEKWEKNLLYNLDPT